MKLMKVHPAWSAALKWGTFTLISLALVGYGGPAMAWEDWEELYMDTTWQGLVRAAMHERETANQARIVATLLTEQARLNFGVFGANVAAFAQLLPGRDLLENSMTGARSEPVDGAAASPGQIGYVPIDRDGDGLWDAARVSAYGRANDLLEILVGDVDGLKSKLAPLRSITLYEQRAP